MARMSEREERSKRGFVYRRTEADVKTRANMRGGGFDSIFKSKYKVYKVRDGKNLIRILPATWEDANHYGYDLWVNYGIGADNESYLSLKKMKNEKDPLDEARSEAQRDGDKDLVRQLSPRQRILMWVIDRNEEDEGPQLFSCPFSLDKAINNLSMDEDTKEVMYVDDEKEGCDVRFYKEGTGLKTDYPAERIKIMKPSPLHSDKGQAREWMEFIQENPLPDCVQFFDYDHIATAFDGVVRSDRDDDADDKPVRKAKSNGKDDDEDEEEAPVRTRKRTTDDSDDEKPVHSRGRATDEDDDEPDEKPARRRPVLDDDEPAPRRRAKIADEDEAEDDEPDEKPRPSIRDRLSRSRKTDDEDDE